MDEMKSNRESGFISKEAFNSVCFEIENKINELIAQKSLFCEKYAAMYCPFKIGDEVISCHKEFKGKKGFVSFIEGIYYPVLNRCVWRVCASFTDKKGKKCYFDFNEFHYSEYKEKGV